MITGFIEGHYYIHSGEIQSGWCSEMNYMADGMPHKCVKSYGLGSDQAGFADDFDDCGIWAWGSLRLFTDLGVKPSVCRTRLRNKRKDG
jgi:hypothetical protein